jgi:hypothetical protein
VEIQEIMRDCLERLYSNKFENFEEIDRWYLLLSKTEPRGY